MYKKPKRRSKGMAFAALMLVVAGSAYAQEDRAAKPDHEILGLDTHPYVALEFARLAGEGEWSPGLTGGLEVDLDPLWVAACYTLHDVLASAEAVPWDGTFTFKLGLYQGGVGKLFSLPTYAHAALTLARPSGPDEWSPGFEAGVEVDAKPLYLGASYTLHDILGEEKDEETGGLDDDVYPWDGTFALSVGAYF